MRSRVIAIAGVGLVSVALASAGCATSPSAYRNRDEPINRTTGEGQQYRQTYSGTVVRVDEPQRVVVLDDGRMYRVTDDQAVIVNGQPVLMSRVQPGTPVTIVGTPVVLQNGQYVAVPPGSVVATQPGTVVTAPPGAVVAAPASRNVVRMHGQVTDVDSNGNVKVRMVDGRAFEFRPPPGVIARRGEPVTIDMTFGATPSASPR
jgi:hypothetical protein